MKKKNTPKVYLANKAARKSLANQTFSQLFTSPAPSSGYQFLNVDYSFSRTGIILQWAAKGLGFGEVSLYLANKKVLIDDEGMGKAFCDALVAKFFQKLDHEPGSHKLNSLFLQHFYNQVQWKKK